jgi:hypothetical protein
VPPQGAPASGGARPQGSSLLLEERARVWPLGPSELMELWGASASVSRPKGPRGSLMLLGGGGDASRQKAARSEASMAMPEAGQQVNNPLWRYLRSPSKDRGGSHGCRRSASGSRCSGVTGPGVFNGRGLRRPAITAPATLATGARGGGSHGGHHGTEEKEDGLPQDEVCAMWGFWVPSWFFLISNRLLCLFS